MGPNYLGLLSDTGTHAVTVAPGGNFSVVGWEFSPLDSLSGVDWSLAAPAGFALQTRELGWPFSDPLAATPTLSGPMGAVLDDVTTAAGPGLYQLAVLRLTAPATPGEYLLTPTSAPGVGVVGAPPYFREWEFSTIQGLAVDVVPPPQPTPEPTVCAALVLAALARLRRRAIGARRQRV